MQIKPQCPVIFASRVIGGRWTAKIIHSLMRNDTLRFSELRRACPPISDRSLSKELKALEAWGIISRYDHETNPPKTEYRLTPFGQSLRPVMETLVTWGRQAQEVVLARSGDSDPTAT